MQISDRVKGALQRISTATMLVAGFFLIFFTVSKSRTSVGQGTDQSGIAHADAGGSGGDAYSQASYNGQYAQSTYGYSQATYGGDASCSGDCADSGGSDGGC